MLGLIYFLLQMFGDAERRLGTGNCSRASGRLYGIMLRSLRDLRVTVPANITVSGFGMSLIPDATAA